MVYGVISVCKIASIEAGLVPQARFTVSVGADDASWATQLMSLTMEFAASAGTPFAMISSMIF